MRTKLLFISILLFATTAFGINDMMFGFERDFKFKEKTIIVLKNANITIDELWLNEQLLKDNVDTMVFNYDNGELVMDVTLQNGEQLYFYGFNFLDVFGQLINKIKG